MKIKSAEDIKREYADLKSEIKIAKKMYKDAYHEDMKETVDIVKIFKTDLENDTPITASDLTLRLLVLTKMIMKMKNEQHMQNKLSVSLMEKSLESVIAVNSIISLLGDFAKDRGLKSVERKVKEIQKFHNEIILKAKQKAEARTKADLSYIR